MRSGNDVRAVVNKLWIGLEALTAVVLFAAAAGCHGQISAEKKAAASVQLTAAEQKKLMGEQKQVRSSQEKVEQDAESEGVANDAVRQSIKVHGHWIITVKNPDGSQANRVEFNNALVLGGTDALTGLLYQKVVAAGFALILQGSSPAPCGTGTCAIVADLGKTPASECGVNQACAANLVFTLDTDKNSIPYLTLSGQITASVAGTINGVGTDIFLCDNGSFPSNLSSEACVAQHLSRAQAFTRHFMSDVPVVAGQIVQVKVTLSFS